MPRVIGTVHFELAISKRGIKREWCERVVNAPVAVVVQESGRTRYWGYISEADRYLRVIILEDQETYHSAMWDRNFRKKTTR